MIVFLLLQFPITSILKKKGEKKSAENRSVIHEQPADIALPVEPVLHHKCEERRKRKEAPHQKKRRYFSLNMQQFLISFIFPLLDNSRLSSLTLNCSSPSQRSPTNHLPIPFSGNLGTSLGGEFAYHLIHLTMSLSPLKK